MRYFEGSLEDSLWQEHRKRKTELLGIWESLAYPTDNNAFHVTSGESILPENKQITQLT